MKRLSCVYFSILLWAIGQCHCLYAQNKFPIGNYEKVCYYKIRSGFGVPQPDKGVPLSFAQTQKLISLITLPENYLPYQSDCFSPHDAFVFWDTQGNKVFEWMLSMDCHNFKANPQIPIAYASGLSVKGQNNIEEFLAEFQPYVKPVIPKGKKTTHYNVEAEETWEGLAIKFSSSVELLKILNGASPSLNPDWDKQNILSKGKNITVIQGMQYFEYLNASSPEVVANIPAATVSTPPFSAPTSVDYSTPRALSPATPPPHAYALSPAGYYVVKSGDSLYQIAKGLGVSMELLMQINQLTSDRLEIGQKLFIRK